MRIYRHPLSSCSRRVLLTLHELGIADTVEHVIVDLPKGAHKAPDYLALNPNGKVPTLVDGELVLWESHAIMQYLADGHSGHTLYPTDRAARADVNRWMFWHAMHFAPAISILNRERMVKKLTGQGEPDAVEVARGEALVKQFGAVLDKHLAGRSWMTGGSLSLADLAIAADLATMERAQLPLGDHTNTLRWFASVRDRGSWKLAESRG